MIRLCRFQAVRLLVTSFQLPATEWHTSVVAYVLLTNFHKVRRSQKVIFEAPQSRATGPKLKVAYVYFYSTGESRLPWIGQNGVEILCLLWPIRVGEDMQRVTVTRGTAKNFFPELRRKRWLKKHHHGAPGYRGRILLGLLG